MAFRDAIDGLEKVIRTDITPPKVILVTGPPGSMKTSFCYTLMSRYLKDTGEFGLYTTLEETVQSHLRNMDSLGVELSMNMQISDFTDLREIDAVVGPEDQTDYLAFIERMITHYRKVHGPLDGEARDRSPQGRTHRPRPDLRSGRVIAPMSLSQSTPERLGSSNEYRRLPQWLNRQS